jgi:hypothetical protein
MFNDLRMQWHYESIGKDYKEKGSFREINTLDHNVINKREYVDLYIHSAS